MVKYLCDTNAFTYDLTFSDVYTFCDGNRLESSTINFAIIAQGEKGVKCTIHGYMCDLGVICDKEADIFCLFPVVSSYTCIRECGLLLQSGEGHREENKSI